MNIKTFTSLTLAATTVLSAAAHADAVSDGAYLARIMDCAGCHMPRGQDGAPIVEAGLSGGNVGFEIPGLGIFWPPNLTPAESGLGAWSEQQIVDALRTGMRPDGRVLAPVMPWMGYAAMTDTDAMALAAYLKSVPPVEAPRLEPVADAASAKAPFYRVTMPQH